VSETVLSFDMRSNAWRIVHRDEMTGVTTGRVFSPASYDLSPAECLLRAFLDVP